MPFKNTIYLILRAYLLSVFLLSIRCVPEKEPSISFDTHRKVILVRTSESIVATNKGKYPLVWSSDNHAVATVNGKGLIKGISPGNSIITASAPDRLLEKCFVTVTDRIPQTIILFIGDGMGYEEVKAAGIFENGKSGSLGFESFEFKNSMTTYSAGGVVTDSAAAATAMATGHKVKNGVVSMAIPGNGKILPTVVEFMKGLGKSTGLVTTSYITDATPAGFGAHADTRSNREAIAADYLSISRPNVLFGGGGNGMSVSSAEKAGYFTVTTKAEFMNLAPGSHTHYSAQFSEAELPYMYDDKTTYPELSDLTQKAIDLLQPNPKGFFLMVEGGRIDHAGHANDLARNIDETVEFEDAVNVAERFMSGRSDTVVLVTADHETGGLKVLRNNGQGKLPEVFWSTTRHTNAPVPLYIHGSGKNLIFGDFDNTQIANLLEDFYR